ncbi:DNA topoisomerase 3-alpha [Stomoxys calcitrans]|uniref:DNA topoisomerase 3-alpha n=1 Tax=Stomoxys calcitrans TaxID=35570 RepID=UPI0027E38A3A|nr:DNA topoisomerase 3-alpha [Stomoxys calcitrans]
MLKLKICTAFRIFRRCYAKKNFAFLEMKYLNVAEKNDAAKTIAAQLSNGTARRREGYSVYNKIYEFEANVKGAKSKMVMTSVSGHLLQLEFLGSYRNWQNVNPESLFEAPVRKACAEQFEPIKRTLEREVRSCQGLIIWTDCDREGENIGFEIIDVCRAVKPNIVVYRAIFSEITSASVRRALQNLNIPDKRQSEAVDVRTELDLRTGAAITRFQTMRLQKLFPEKISDKLISYGSCQIPTLGFVAERYKEIEAFVSEPFWKIKVTHTIDDLTVEFSWARNRLFDKKACEDYYLLCISNPKATVESVTVKPKNKWRPTPMDTVELEKLGSRKLKLSAKEVMTIAEKLYTKGIISYPRTETNMFSKEIDLRSLVQQHTSHEAWGSFAERVMEWGPNPRNGTKSDQAHPPIHPTKMVPNLDGNEGRVYELICRHFLACVSKDAVGSETVVTITIEGEKFTANGLVIFERNYLDVYIYEKWNAKQIHKYEQGQEFEPTEITMPEGHTTAPPLLTEADLIALMEKHGIGTDATHAEHINTIKERGYIGVVDNGSLVPGVIGMGLYEGYDAMELALAKPLLRAEFEADLKKICLGEKDPKTVLKDQIIKYKESYKQIMDKITAMDEKMSQRIQEAPKEINSSLNNQVNTPENSRWQELFKCPKCTSAPLALKQKNNKTGYFIGCLNYPNCKHCIWLPDECKDPSVLNDHCTKCGSEYKLIKLRFSLPYHKTLFNTPSGWYKTCLVCDSQFQNTFNINVDCVKRTGPIVSDISSIPINYGATDTNSAQGGINRKPKKETTRKKKTETATATGTSKKTMLKSTTSSTKTSNSNTIPDGTIRSYFTSANKPATDFDAFFDSNDGFDELILAAETNLPSSIFQTQKSTTTIVNSQYAETVLSADLAAAFNDDDDDFFANIPMGSTTPSNSNSVSTSNRNTNCSSELNDSLSTVFQNENDFGDDYVWGSAAKNARISESSNASEPVSKKPKIQIHKTKPLDKFSWGSSQRSPYGQNEHSLQCSGCHTAAKELSVKKDGPNKGRIFYVCSKSNPCKFFQWADEINADQNELPSTSANKYAPSRASNEERRGGWGSTETADSAATLNCNCNKPANSLTVRKEGPNKGRGFYACANREKSCGFFQWADENGNHDTMAWGSGGGNFSSGQTGNPASNKSKTRKCGLCRQEGHSRQKCPRKAEFEHF